MEDRAKRGMIEKGNDREGEKENARENGELTQEGSSAKNIGGKNKQSRMCLAYEVEWRVLKCETCLKRGYMCGKKSKNPKCMHREYGEQERVGFLYLK